MRGLAIFKNLLYRSRIFYNYKYLTYLNIYFINDKKSKINIILFLSCSSSCVNHEKGGNLTVVSKIKTSESHEAISIIGGNDLTTIDELILYIRRSRMGLIQTPAQLRFCWKAIYDWIKKRYILVCYSFICSCRLDSWGNKF